MTTNLNLASLKANATGAITTRTLGDRFADVLNVKDFGTVGDGTGDDGPAIQACFDAAFGSASSPHGNANRKLNKAVHIPAGEYNIGAPLYLTSVCGGHIYGDGSLCTRLQYTGSASDGNTVAQGGLSGGTIAAVRAFTPLIITNGYKHVTMSGLNLAQVAGSQTVGFYLFWNGSADGGPTQNIFQDMLFEAGGTGVLIGYMTPGLCSETTFIACTCSGQTVHGWRNISSNALNNNLIGCGANECAVAVSAPTGNMNLFSCNFANGTSGIDIETGQNPMLVMGCRTESNNFISMGASTATHTLITCVQQQSAGTPTGYFADISGCTAVLINCRATREESGAGKLITSSSGKAHITFSDFMGANYLSSFSGNIIADPREPQTVASLPTAAAYLNGVRRFVTDANATTFMSTVAGGGSNNVPVVCDGTNWKIG